MMRVRLRRVHRRAAGSLFLASLCLMPGLRMGIAPAHASTVHVEYEDTFGDVEATDDNAIELKAAFLLRFLDFVDWEEPIGDSLCIGVNGEGRLLDVLRALAEFENQPGFGPPHIHVVHVADAEAAQRCHVLVLGASPATETLAPLLAGGRSGLLTVGVWDAPRPGAVIRLFREGNQVRFDISQTLAKEAGLHISSKLLNLASEQSSGLLLDRGQPWRG